MTCKCSGPLARAQIRERPGPLASGLVRGGPGPRGRRIYSRGEPGPRGSKLSANKVFFFEVSDSDVRLSRFIAKLGNEIMYTIK